MDYCQANDAENPGGERIFRMNFASSALSSSPCPGSRRTARLAAPGGGQVQFPAWPFRSSPKGRCRGFLVGPYPFQLCQVCQCLRLSVRASHLSEVAVIARKTLAGSLVQRAVILGVQEGDFMNHSPLAHVLCCQ